MDATKISPSAAQIYEDFVPKSELASNEDCDTLLIHLPGFKKEQLRVQLSEGTLRISGSMPSGDNKMRRFQKEFPVSANCETNKITATFQNGSLHLKQPKFITPTTAISAAQEPKKPVNELGATQNVAEKANGNQEGGEAGEGKKITRNEEKIEAKNGGVNIRLENYRKMVRGMGQRLEMQRRVMNFVLAAVFTCIFAIYVNNLIASKN